MAEGKCCVLLLLAFTSLLVLSSHGSPTPTPTPEPHTPESPSTESPTTESPTTTASREGGNEEKAVGEGGGREGSPHPLPPSQTQGQEGQDSVAGKEDQLVTEFLLKYGYFRHGKPLHLQERSSDADDRPRRAERGVASEDVTRSLAIRRFQSFVGLPPTGKVDRETIRLMQKDRCGVADLPEEKASPKAYHMTDGSQSPSEYTLLGTKWEHTKLTWRLDRPSNQIHPRKQQKTMRDAFATWARVAPLSFQEKRGRGEVDISIQFRSGHHGDDYPFDGRGKVLAHAFGPGEGSISGDMHMDNDEKWTGDSNRETSDRMFLVATHELGHSLGLAHSRDPAALMYPYYGFTDTLGQDDIKAIQFLYGARIGKPPVTPTPRRRRPTTTTTTTTRPGTRVFKTKSATSPGRRKRPGSNAGCDVTFDAVFRDDGLNAGVYTGIKGNLVYRFNQGGLLDGYPSTLNSVYPRAPVNADAVFGLPDKNAAYFIKGLRVWRYTQFQLDPAYPKSLDHSHFPETIRFILPVIDTSGAERIFVFGKTMWLDYNFDSLPSQVPRIHDISQYWPDVATDVMYAVNGFDGNIYLVSPQSHVVMNGFRKAMKRQQGHPHWMQAVCHVSSGSPSPVRPSAFLAMLLTLLAVFRNC